MDPNAALTDLLDALARGDRDDYETALDALNHWHAIGGYLPVDPRTPAPWGAPTDDPTEADDDDPDECPVLVEVQGPPLGELVGPCRCGRPMYRSRLAGTPYHATEDGHPTD